MSFTTSPLKASAADLLYSIFSIKSDFCEFIPGHHVLPSYYGNIAQDILDLEVKDDDIFLVSHPRTGSTWLQEAVWLIGNNCDFDLAQTAIQHIRAPMLEMDIYLYHYNKFWKENVRSCIDIVKDLPSPRFIKTHVPFELLPTQLDKIKPKIVYIARNPKDMCVSYFHFCTKFYFLDTTFEKFAELMLQDLTPIGPVLRHYLTFWNKRHESNILFLKYEDMKRDFPGSIRKLAKFLEKPITDQQVDAVCNYLSFSNMRNNPTVNMIDFQEIEFGKNDNSAHIRKGEMGDWKNHMSPELSERFDKWMEKNLKGTGLFFD